jgi:putative ABC transport system ATP-binding protein
MAAEPIMKTTTSKRGPIIEVRDVTKSFATPGGTFSALRGVSLAVERGQMIAITGKSGSGKSTLLNVIAGIDRASGGTIVVDGTAIDGLSESALARWRGRTIGFVFQFFQLLPTLTVLENVMLPMDFCNTFPRGERADRALAQLERVGIREQAHKLPATLSGGQQQRAAIARALANEPPILVADEPTGNLDSGTATAIFTLFDQLAKEGTTVLVVTHEKEFSKYFEATVAIVDGLVVDAVGVAAPVRALHAEAR